MKMILESLNENTLLSLGLSFFFLLHLLPQPSYKSTTTYFDIFQQVSSTFSGNQIYSDFAQDVVGARALYHGTDPYPILGTGFKTIGIDWDVKYPSTHPPTVFLLSSVVAFLPYGIAARMWSYLMLGCIVLVLRLLEFSWKNSIGLAPLTLLWPPAAISVIMQITPIWALGLSFAFRRGGNSPYLRGTGIALASFTKFVPAMALALFLRTRNNVRLFIGFAVTWILAIVTLHLLNPKAIPQYIVSSRIFAPDIMRRPDNASVFVNANRYFGMPGLIVAIAFVGFVLFRNRKLLFAENAAQCLRSQQVFYWIAIVVLPITWIYSVFPLFPLFVVSGERNWKLSSFIKLAFIVATSVFSPWDPLTAKVIAAGLLWIGLIFLLEPAPQQRVGQIADAGRNQGRCSAK